MATVPESVSDFLGQRRLAVAGVSRDPSQAANAVYRRLRDSGFEVFPVNPKASEVEGVRCYPGLDSVPGPIDGVVIATHPGASVEVVRQCAALGVGRVWLHRSFGEGSVSAEAIRECEVRGIRCIVPTDATIGTPAEHHASMLRHSLAFVARLTMVDELLVECRSESSRGSS